jgi:hypothetical protein
MLVSPAARGETFRPLAEAGDFTVMVVNSPHGRL